MAEKTIRCTKCYKEFSDEEILGKSSCPDCGSKGLPHFIRNDVTITLNWHELRILTIWAKNWASEKAGEGGGESLDAIIERLMKYRPKGAAPLTLEMEVRELQDKFPGATLYKNGKVVIPPLDEGQA